MELNVDLKCKKDDIPIVESILNEVESEFSKLIKE